MMPQFALQLPDSLLAYAHKVAEEEQVPMNQFFIMAIAEKVSALKTEAYFRERMARGNLDAFDAWMEASPDSPPMEGDDLLADSVDR